jgi:hypothetical protein
MRMSSQLPITWGHLNQPVTNGHHECTSPGDPAWEFIGPKFAEEMLSKIPPEQRDKKKSYIERLADDMRSEAWVDCTDPIVISKDGYLLNGQHRLSAVVLSGKVIRFLVVRGVDRKAYGKMDRCLPRNTVDTLRADGLAICKNTVATIRSAMGLYRIRGVSDRKIYDTYVMNKGHFDLVYPIENAAHAVFRGCLVRAILHYSIKSLHQEWSKCKRIISLLRSEINPEEYTPQDSQFLIMWERYKDYPQSGNGKVHEARRYMGMISRYCLGEIIHKSTISETDIFPPVS